MRVGGLTRPDRSASRTQPPKGSKLGTRARCLEMMSPTASETGFQMSTIALYTWMVTVLAGLLLLVIWIMEYDREFQSAAATRLPVPLITTHALLGMGGLL